MSRYVTLKDNGIHYEYGHDHFSGYFVQIYNQGNLVCEIDEFAGFQWDGADEANMSRNSFRGETLVALCQTFFDKLVAKEIVCELMIRDPKKHLGAAIGAAIKEARENG